MEMRIQGWEKTALFDSLSYNDEEEDGYSTPLVSAKKAAVTTVRRSEDVPRAELLKKIKEKIAAGFYNRDSVIDDIGYGFAQAIDNSI